MVSEREEESILACMIGRYGCLEEIVGDQHERNVERQFRNRWELNRDAMTGGFLTEDGVETRHVGLIE